MLRTRALFTVGLIFLLVPSISGCDLFGDNDRDVRLRTDQRSYAANPPTTIQLTVTNSYDDSVYYICTGQIHLEELEEGKVVDSWLVHGFEECLHRNPIESGESDTFEMSFEGSLEPDRLETAQFDESVRYRLRFDLFETNEVDQQLDKKDRLSNRFKIIR